MLVWTIISVVIGFAVSGLIVISNYFEESDDHTYVSIIWGVYKNDL